jgi:hypothetical protein
VALQEVLIITDDSQLRILNLLHSNVRLHSLQTQKRLFLIIESLPKPNAEDGCRSEEHMEAEPGPYADY